MNKIIRYTLPVVLGCVMSSISCAGTLDKGSLVAQCAMTVKHLQDIIQGMPHDKCSGDVAIAAAYVDAAKVQIMSSHYNQALVSLHYGENELRSIAYSRAYCANFSSLVKPSIAQVIRIMGELETKSKE